MSRVASISNGRRRKSIRAGVPTEECIDVSSIRTCVNQEGEDLYFGILESSVLLAIRLSFAKVYQSKFCGSALRRVTREISGNSAIQGIKERK